MKTYVYEINNSVSKLINKAERELIEHSKNVLIQLFSGEDAATIQNILNDLTQLFPNAIIITATTDGEILQGRVVTNSSVLSVSIFEKTSLKIAFCDEKESFEAGKILAQELTTKDTKLIITFANGLLCNGEEYLEGIYSISPDTIIAGGLSADNAKFKRCYVGINGTLYDKGAVGVSLNSTSLSVNNFYSFGWSSIGLKHKITKAKKNRVYTIDNMTTVDFYTKYLGENVSDELPKTGIEFPLIIDENGLKKARAAIAKHDDGSLSFAGNISEGEYAYIGIGEVKTILSNPIEKIDDVKSVESFFIYSCMARRRFIPDLIHQEIEPFANLAPTSGFFTYGEFYTDTRPELLNQTMTALALSESDTPNLHKYNKKQYDVDNTTKALMHIINVTSKELHEQTLLQEKISNELSAKNNTIEMIQEMSNLGSWELDLSNMKINWSKMSYKIYNISQDEDPPSYLDFINMVVPEDRKKLLDVHKELDDAKIHSVEIRVKRNDDKILTLLESGKLIFDNGEPVKIVGTTLDITDIRMQDAILIRQSKSAQMGEMINMIAHQWRQPLNAISSAAIKLNIQSEMDILTKEDISDTTQFIEDMTQKMSQTINDFMNFTKPNNTKELISFKSIFEDIFNIIGTQLTNHNISVDIDIQTPTSIFTYKKELEHILINIITNARDALEELHSDQKQIDIKVSTKDQLCIIKISDNAGGIKENIIDRIFDPYFTTKDSNKGTGLGLYMSKKILQEHLNGNIFVQNKNNGAEFTITLDKNNE